MTSELFVVLLFIWIFQLFHPLNCLFYSYFFFVNSNELSLSLSLNFIRNLIGSNFREIITTLSEQGSKKFIISGLNILPFHFGHDSIEYFFEQLNSKLCFLKHILLMTRMRESPQIPNKIHLNISQNGLNKRITNFLNSITNPWLKIKELSFTSNNCQWYRKLIVVPCCKWY